MKTPAKVRHDVGMPGSKNAGTASSAFRMETPTATKAAFLLFLLQATTTAMRATSPNTAEAISTGVGGPPAPSGGGMGMRLTAAAMARRTNPALLAPLQIEAPLVIG